MLGYCRLCPRVTVTAINARLSMSPTYYLYDFGTLRRDPEDLQTRHQGVVSKNRQNGAWAQGSFGAGQIHPGDHARAHSGLFSLNLSHGVWAAVPITTFSGVM